MALPSLRALHTADAGAAALGAVSATTVALMTSHQPTFAPSGSVSPFFLPHLQIAHDESQSKPPSGISPGTLFREVNEID